MTCLTVVSGGELFGRSVGENEWGEEQNTAYSAELKCKGMIKVTTVWSRRAKKYEDQFQKTTLSMQLT